MIDARWLKTTNNGRAKYWRRLAKTTMREKLNVIGFSNYIDGERREQIERYCNNQPRYRWALSRCCMLVQNTFIASKSEPNEKRRKNIGQPILPYLLILQTCFKASMNKTSCILATVI